MATAGGETVALDLHVTPELRRAGLARDVVRFLQETRKATGLDVADRIRLTWEPLPEAETGTETAEAVREHAAMIADEVLAVEFAEGEVATDEDPAELAKLQAAIAGDADLGLRFRIAKAI